MNAARHSRQTAQRGATLVVAMVMLILMSLFAITAYNGSSGNLRVIGNAQVRQEGQAAAQKAVEGTISSGAFTLDPDLVAATPVSVDVSGDGVADYTVQLTPKPGCYRAKSIKAADLNPDLDADRLCMKSSKVDSSGLDSEDATSASGDSACVNTEWNVRGQVSDQRTAIKVAVNQGVAVRVYETDADNFCH